MIDSDSSFHYRESQFNAGDSERIYLGKVDDNTESMLLFKINKELISNNNLCQEDDVDFNNLELRIFMKNGIPGLGINSDNIMPGDDSNFTINDSGNQYTDCVAMDIGDTCIGECINNWIYQDNITEQDCEALDSYNWTSEESYCGNLGETSQCCKYMGCISCCPSSNQMNSQNLDSLVNAYALETTLLNSYVEHEDNKNHSTDWYIDNVDGTLEVNFISSYLLSVNLYDYLTNKYNTEDLDFCNLDDDISVLLELGSYFNELYNQDYIEFYSTDDSHATYYYYKPYLLVNHDETVTITEKNRKYVIDNDNINFNNFISDNVMSSILNSDSINVLSFSGIEQSDVFPNGIDNLSPVINQGFDDELFNFDITLDDAYLDRITLLDTLDDIIKFRFKKVSFIVEDLDPLNDDWLDLGSDGCDDYLENGSGGCLTIQDDLVYSNENLDPNGDNYNDQNNLDGTQGNGVYDIGEGTEENFFYDGSYENFDDFGTDLCPDQYENGVGGCLCDINNSGCDNFDFNSSIYNASGQEGNNKYDEGEYFDQNLDVGNDGCSSPTEDGNGGCIADGDDAVYDSVTNPDPNSDDYNLDPGEDNWEDTGSDSCFDEQENGNGGCLSEGDSIVYSESNLDPNGDNYDFSTNISGTEGNGSYNTDEGTENNLQYDGPAGDFPGENWVDAGIDQLFDAYEPGYDAISNPDPHNDNYHPIDNPTGTESDNIYNPGEWYFDYGVDNISNSEEYDIGYSVVGTENNGEYDLEENFLIYDIGADQCPNIYESGNSNIPCLCDYIDDVLTGNNLCDNVGGIVYDSVTNPDPNKDDYNDDPNIDNESLGGNENNQEWNFVDFGRDGCEDVDEDGFGGCIEEGDNIIYSENNLDPNGDNYDSENNVNGSEGNGILDYDFSNFTFWEDGGGEKFETFYDFGEGSLSVDESNYLGNYTTVSLTDLFYMNAYNNLELNDVISGSKTNNPDANVFLWINEVKKIGDNKYNVSVHLESFIDIIAFEMHLYHDYFEYEVEAVDDKDIGLWPYDDNVGNTGEKYIVDSSVYDFDDSLCSIDYDCSDNGVNCICDDEDPLVLSYGHGIKNQLSFYNEDESFSEFLNGLKNSSQFTVFSDEYTKLLLYFDVDNSFLHNVDQYTEINFEYFDEEINEYVLYPIYNQTVTINQDYISIPIVSLIQSYLVGDINIFDYDFEIVLSSPSNKFNFSKISINDIESRIEVFYSE